GHARADRHQTRPRSLYGSSNNQRAVAKVITVRIWHGASRHTVGPRDGSRRPTVSATRRAYASRPLNGASPVISVTRLSRYRTVLGWTNSPRAALSSTPPAAKNASS